MMKLYLISQTENSGYDTYDSAVVAAVDEDAARSTLPSEYEKWNDVMSAWCKSPSDVTVEYIGEAKEETKAGVVCASFNAG